MPGPETIIPGRMSAVVSEPPAQSVCGLAAVRFVTLVLPLLAFPLMALTNSGLVVCPELGLLPDKVKPVPLGAGLAATVSVPNRPQDGVEAALQPAVYIPATMPVTPKFVGVVAGEA